MSVEAIQWALNFPHNNPSHKAVLIGLANHANPDGQECYPSITRLERYTGLGKRTIVRAIKQMEELGIISAKHSRGKLTRYTLHLDLELVPEGHRCQSDTSAPDDTQLVPLTTSTSATGAPKPYSNRQENRPIKRAHVLPDEWQPDDTRWQKAVDRLGSVDAAETELEKFQNYYWSAPDAKARKKDWGRTWDNWILNACEYRKRTDSDVDFAELLGESK